MAEEKKFYGMGNDYMCHAVLQEREDILKHLVATLMEMDYDDIRTCIILNPIELGSSIDAKDCILDVKLILNDEKIVNLELQMWYRNNWTDRSLIYWSRAFDTLKTGEDYSKVKPTFHVGILDFTLFDDDPGFYNEYMLMNTSNHRLYSSKMCIRVLDLTRIEEAKQGIDTFRNRKIDDELIRWARIFKAKSQKEIEELTKDKEALRDMAVTIAKLSEEEKIRYQCWAREDYELTINTERAAGIRQGIEQGIEQGREQGIKSLVTSCKELTNDFSLAVEQLMKQYNLEKDEAEKKVRLYW